MTIYALSHWHTNAVPLSLRVKNSLQYSEHKTQGPIGDPVKTIEVIRDVETILHTSRWKIIKTEMVVSSPYEFLVYCSKSEKK